MGAQLRDIDRSVVARKEPELVFASPHHHIIDVDNLRARCNSPGAEKAPGVDGVTKAEYGKNL